jgi:hypothetical protein
MIIRTIRDSESLDSVAEELLFTSSRLDSDEHGKEFAPAVTTLIAQVDLVRTGQVGASRDEVAAQAAVSAADDLLDDWIQSFSRTLNDIVRGDTQSPLYKRYFTAAPWTFIRMGLESEISRVRGWVDSLASESNPSLKDLSARLATLIAQGEAALDRRRKAASARSDHRVRSITSLIEEVNATRAALYGQLATKATETGLPLDWPGRFFRKSGRARTQPSHPSDNSNPDKPDQDKTKK